MKFGISVADIYHFYRTLSRVTVFSWTQCIFPVKIFVDLTSQNQSTSLSSCYYVLCSH